MVNYQISIMFWIIVVACVVVLVIAAVMPLKKGEVADNDESWYDENGNHTYYDRKLIKEQKRK